MGSLQYTSNISVGDGDGAIYLVSGVEGFYNEYYCIIPMLNGGSTLYSILVVLLDKRTKSNLGLNEGNTTVFLIETMFHGICLLPQYIFRHPGMHRIYYDDPSYHIIPIISRARFQGLHIQKLLLPLTTSLR